MKTNPFVFGTVVGDENFAGREDEINELTRDLAGKTNLIIFSPRRYGKTSLMFKVIDELKKQGIVCVYADLYPAVTKEKFTNILTSSIAKAKSGKIDEIIQIIKELILPIKLSTRPEETKYGLELELSKGKEDIDANLTRLYDLLERVARKMKKKLVVIFDEFQEITKLDGREIEINISSKLQQHKNVSYVFMRSQRHLLDQVFSDKNRPLYRIGKPFNLGRLSKEEFSKFIKKRFKAEGGIVASNDTISQILQLTQCHPYYTQQLCHEIWNQCISQEKKNVEDGDIAQAKEQVLKNQNYAYTSMWDSIKGKQRVLLHAMTMSGENNIFSTDFREKYGLGASSTVARVVEYLEEKGLIEKDDVDYVISDAFFQEWIKRIN